MGPAADDKATIARRAWVQNVLDVRLADTAGTGGETTEAVFEQPDTKHRRPVLEIPLAAAPASGLLAWKAARTAALATLKELEGAYRGFDHPDASEGIILLRAIQANLTAEPITPQQVDELERYVGTDDILVEAEEPNGFGITVVLRQPLLAAISSLRAAMASSGASR